MYEKLQDADWLKKQYIDAYRTLQEIADEVGCNKTTVQRSLRKLGIERRKRTAKYQILSDREWLHNAYVVDQRSLNDIAQEVNSTAGNVAEHLRQFGIGRRSIQEARAMVQPEGRFGENGANWKGGRVIRNGYVLLYAPWHPAASPGHPHVQEHRLVMEEKLDRFLEDYEVVHHLDGNKQNNDPSNLEVKTRGRHISEHFKASHEVLQLRRKAVLLEERVRELEEQSRTIS